MTANALRTEGFCIGLNIMALAGFRDGWCSNQSSVQPDTCQGFLVERG